MPLIGQLNRLDPDLNDLGLAVLDRFAQICLNRGPGQTEGQAEAGPDLKIVCFTILMHVLYFWFPSRYWPGLGFRSSRLGKNRLRPRPDLEAQPAD